jgi:hypothetical protein
MQSAKIAVGYYFTALPQLTYETNSALRGDEATFHVQILRREGA